MTIGGRCSGGATVAASSRCSSVRKRVTAWFGSTPRKFRPDRKTPPAFIVHGADDDKVPASNAQDIYAAFREAGVPAELQLLPGAGHGFGLRGTGPGKEWPLLCAAWLRRTGVLAP